MEGKSESGRTHLPVACSLSGSEMAARRRELNDEIFNHALWEEEIEEGFEFGFPGSAEWPDKLVRMIEAERECCRFLIFDLRFEPDNGPVSLRVTGPEGTKEFVKDELMPRRIHTGDVRGAVK